MPTKKTTKRKKTPDREPEPKKIGWGIDPEKYAAARKPKPKPS